MTDRAVWTLTEAAEYLGISRTTAWRLAGAGQLPGAFKVGRAWRVSSERLMAAVKQEVG